MALKAAALFDQMVPFLKTNGADLVKKVNAVFHFDLSATKGGPVTSWTIDLKNGNGVYGNFILFYKSISNGKVGKADATFTMLDADFMGVAAGTLNPQQAFMQGKMKIKGNMAAATKFTPDLLPKGAKL